MFFFFFFLFFIEYKIPPLQIEDMFCMSTFLKMRSEGRISFKREKDFYQVKIIFTKEPHKRSQRKWQHN